MGHLTDQWKLVQFRTEVDRQSKYETTVWVLFGLLGWLGAHRFYLGDTLIGIFMLLTLGGLGLWLVIELFMLPETLKLRRWAVEESILREWGR